MAVVLLLNSGGLDSAIMARGLKTQLGHTVHSLHIDTDLIAAPQNKVAAATTASNWCDSHTIVPVKWGNTPNFFECSIAEEDMTAQDLLDYPTIPRVRWYADLADPEAFYLSRPYYEFRTLINTALIVQSIGGAVAQSYGCYDVYAGTRLTLQTQFIDTFNTFHDMTRMHITKPTMHLPLKGYFSYREVLEQELGLDVDNPTTRANINSTMGYTHSCRWPTPCGICEKCIGRADVGILD